ncbi:hypothetical protein J2R98_000123 [Alkalibacillus filiformis]|uniref:Uncharacterized protein n=1 Tax=Alkalibacillus filiformis TaxID=200990 RepID=A0ABU0DQ37_9BACI|nr:hypothetical protein [Alkalibacillus filiformis]MDQ0350320.1 hypothetical protein [Alkalibacillus filiformis]
MLDGYEPEQYFGLQMNTTFKKGSGDEYIRADGVGEYEGREKVTVGEIERVIK